MSGQVAERRRHRRVDLLEGRVEIRGEAPQGKAPMAVVGRTRNVSLAGCFALMPAPFPWTAGSPVTCAVTIPQGTTKQFPFVRLIATGWVVRVTPTTLRSRRAADPAATKADEPEVDVAIAFTDVTPLATTSSF